VHKPSLTYHVSIPGNLLDEKFICPSVHIDAFLDVQKRFQSSTMNLLASSMLIVDDIIVMYKKLFNFAKKVGNESHAALFIASVSQDLAPACSLVLGGRLDAAYAIARRNIEILGASRIIATNSAAGSIWSNAHKDNKSWKSFKRLFVPKHMFANGTIVWDKLYTLYDMLAKTHHPNPESFDRIKQVERTKGRIFLAISSISFSPNDADENAKAIWFICYIFCVILTGFCDILFEKNTGEQRKELTELANRVVELTGNTWREIGDSDKRDLS